MGAAPSATGHVTASRSAEYVASAAGDEPGGSASPVKAARKPRRPAKGRRRRERRDAGNESEEESLSSLSGSEEGPRGREGRTGEEGREEEAKVGRSNAKDAGIDPQRRCHYIEVPVGTSGTLTRRVFEVRERKVEACPEESKVVPSQPFLCLATTDMIIVRWEAGSWAEARTVSQYELQWTQPTLKKNKYLEVWSFEVQHHDATAAAAAAAPVHDGEEGKNAQPEQLYDQPALLFTGTEDGSVLGPEEQKVELFCDNKFCTLPNKVVNLLDLRAEVKLFGLGGGCAPLLFRVRAKLAHLGWGPWSPVSEPIQTLPRVEPALAPQPAATTAHSLEAAWGMPRERVYGKVSAFRLFGAMLDRHGRFGRAKLASYCGELEQTLCEAAKAGTLASASAEHDIRWVELYSGTETRLAIGEAPAGAQPGAAQAARELLASSLSDGHGNLQAAGMERGLLPPDWPFLFRVEAESGVWFHGTFRSNSFSSPVVCVWTGLPTYDEPSPPELPPFHGMALSRQLTLQLEAPRTYGGGHRADTFDIFFPFGRTSGSWFGIDAGDRKKGGKKAKAPVARSWGELLAEEKAAAQVRLENLRAEGWYALVDADSGATFWTNSLSGEVSWTTPDASELPVREFVLSGRYVTAAEDLQQEFKVMYRGARRHVKLENLRPNTYYEFQVHVRSTLPGAKPSKTSQVVRYGTAEPSRERLSLPVGWLELWDATTGHMYYHNQDAKRIQWEHPCGSGIDDLDLPFRQKRFKLLHEVHTNMPPAKNIETLKLHLRRDRLLQDSVSQFATLAVSDLSRRLNINFEGENGIDSGGITTEWYLEASKAFFKAENELAAKCEASQLYRILPGPPGREQDEHDGLYYFLGRLMGKAVYDKRVLFAPFCSFVWGHLLGRAPTLDDLQEIDPQLHQSLMWMLGNDVTDIIFETFTVLDEGEQPVELKLGGAEIEVTEANKDEYVRLVVRYTMSDSIQAPLEKLKQGFHEILPRESLRELHMHDLELLLNGSAEVDVKTLRRRARYANGYTDKSKPVQYFWSLFEGASPELQGEILAFVTGSTKMPLDDLSLQIVRSDEGPETLPSSHTCFFQLVLPVFESQQQLQEKLMVALENSGGFYMT